MLAMIQIARERKAMRTSLYDLSVPTFLQTVRSVGGFLDRAAAHFSNTGVDPDNFVNTRLFDDMAPFHLQIEAAASPRRGRPGRPLLSSTLRRASDRNRSDQGGRGERAGLQSLDPPHGMMRLPVAGNLAGGFIVAGS